MTQIITAPTVSELRQHVSQAHQKGLSVGFVPTMGNLHEGHMSLVRQAATQCDYVVSSIFVNPLQFNDQNDLSRYPRTFEQDKDLLENNGCHLVFAPDVDEMYPSGQENQTIVSVPDVSEGLCGGARPGHFDGVATVVSKLFNMVQADKAFFGEKDFQQLAVIRKMVRDLCIPTEIIGVPTERNASGLALSSRNGYLTPDELRTATGLYQTLQEVAEAIRQGNAISATMEAARERFSQRGFRVDYLELYNAETLKPAITDDTNLVVLGAGFLGAARLIDNLPFSLNRIVD